MPEILGTVHNAHIIQSCQSSVLALFLTHTPHTHAHTPPHTHVVKVINKENWGSFTRLDPPSQHLCLHVSFVSHLKHKETQHKSVSNTVQTVDVVKKTKAIRSHICYISLQLEIVAATVISTLVNSFKCAVSVSQDHFMVY